MIRIYQKEPRRRTLRICPQIKLCSVIPRAAANNHLKYWSELCTATDGKNHTLLYKASTLFNVPFLNQMYMNFSPLLHTQL